MAFEGKNNRRPSRERPQNEYEQRIIDLARVTRVQKGGKRLRFRILLALGDKNLAMFTFPVWAVPPR